MPKNFNKIGKIFFWTSIIIVLSALIYFGLKQEKIFSFSFGPGFNFLKDNYQDFEPFKETVSGLSVKLGENIGEVFNKGKSLADKTIRETKEIIKEKTKEKTFEIVQEGLKSVEETAGNILGADSKQIVNQSSSSDFFTYLIKINTPLSFIIKNPFSLAGKKNINYQIDWGDNKKDSGELKTEQSIIVTHSWNKEGEYLVQLKITTVESEKFNYQIKILAVK